MIKPLKIIILSFFIFGGLFAIVGDWTSYGSQLTLNDLTLNDGKLIMSSHGGIVVFDPEQEAFSTQSVTLEHIDLQKYYVNPDGS